MFKTILFTLSLCFSLITEAVVCDESSLKITSWNVRDFGKSKSDNEIKFISYLLKDSDVVTIQEVVAGKGGEKAVHRLLNQLKKYDNSWVSSVSKKSSGKGSEKYAFLWKNTAVKSLDKENKTLNLELSKTIDREPFVKNFLFNKTPVALVSFHAVPTKKKPSLEIIQLDEIDEVESNSPIIIMGDFNLGFKNRAFDELRENGLRSHIKGKTALKRKRKNGKWLTHPYDNIFTEHLSVCDSGINDFSTHFNTLKAARYISDHLPVWIKVNI